MSKFVMCLAAASVLALGGTAFAQSAPQQPVNPSTAPQPQAPQAPAAAPEAPQAPAGAAAPAAPAAPVPVAQGMSVKDNKGVTIGQITELKPDAKGTSMATIKMGTDSFTVDASALAVQEGAAVINLTQAELQAQVHKPKA